MPACVSCGADFLPDSQFCEACGHKVGEPAPNKSEPPAAKAGPGSLRSEVAFLAGAVDQAKVRIDNWRHKGDQAKLQAEREANIQRIDKEQQKEAPKKRGALQTLMQMVVGLVALAAFVYLLIKMPRKTSPYAMMCLYKQLLQTIQEEFGEFMGGDDD